MKKKQITEFIVTTIAKQPYIIAFFCVCLSILSFIAPQIMYQLQV